MATLQSTVEHLLEQYTGSAVLAVRKMFGEYVLYHNSKIVGLICDNQLFVKPNPAAKIFLGRVEEKLPYPKAKPHYLITADRWDDRDWLSELLDISAAVLPMPKPKKKG